MKRLLLILNFLFLFPAFGSLHVDLREVKDSAKKQVLQELVAKGLSPQSRARLSKWQAHPKTAVVSFEGHIHHQDVNRGGSFQKFSGEINSQGQVTQLRREVPIALSQMKFVVRAYMKNLVTEVEAPDLGIRILFPFGGPGIDHGVTPRAAKGSVFMTPFFQGHLTKSTTIAKRCEPAHYKCKPFIRLIPEGNNHSLYGYHTEPFQDVFERGFVSAGCFRLQDSDLWELYQLVRFGFLNRIPFEMIEHEKSMEGVHPYPIVQDAYEGITRWRLKEGRIVFNSKRIKQAPPLDSIRFQTLEEVKRIDQQTRQRIGRDTSTFYTRPE